MNQLRILVLYGIETHRGFFREFRQYIFENLILAGGEFSSEKPCEKILSKIREKNS